MEPIGVTFVVWCIIQHTPSCVEGHDSLLFQYRHCLNSVGLKLSIPCQLFHYGIHCITLLFLLPIYCVCVLDNTGSPIGSLVPTGVGQPLVHGLLQYINSIQFNSIIVNVGAQDILLCAIGPNL